MKYFQYLVTFFDTIIDLKLVNPIHYVDLHFNLSLLLFIWNNNTLYSLRNITQTSQHLFNLFRGLREDRRKSGLETVLDIQNDINY